MPRAMDGGIMWERLERHELKRRARLTDGAAQPRQRPVPSQPAGTDLLPQIEHASHLQWRHGSCQGFVASTQAELPDAGADAVGMGYWTWRRSGTCPR